MSRLAVPSPGPLPAAMRKLTVLLVNERSEICCDLAAAMKLAGASVIRADWDTRTLLDLPPILDRVDAVALPASWPLTVAQRASEKLLVPPVSRAVLVYCESSEIDRIQQAGLVALRWPYVDIAELAEILLTTVQLHRARNEQPQAQAPVAELVGRLIEYERELRAGRETQRGFLPQRPVCPQGWEVEARLRAAREVAGDFYDVFDLLSGRRIALVVADVCDKGVAAALFMALIRTLLRQIAEAGDPGPLMYRLLSRLVAGRPGTHSPPEVARNLRRATLPAAGAAQLYSAVHGTNDYLVRMHGGQGYFATMFFGVLDPSTGKLRYINAGHLPGILLRTGGEPELLSTTGPAVGLLQDAGYEVGEVALMAGDTLLLHTDGLTDARNAAGSAFGVLRLQAEVRRPARSARELLDRLDLLVSQHVRDARQFDDMTSMALRRLPATAGAVDRRQR